MVERSLLKNKLKFLVFVGLSNYLNLPFPKKKRFEYPVLRSTEAVTEGVLLKRVFKIFR